MPYLIDGSNLCGAARDRRLGLPRDEQEMVRLLARFTEARSARLRIVFDGAAGGRGGGGRARRAGRVAVHYSGARTSADDVIVELALADRTPRDLIVVTSDAGLRARVRAVGCKVVGCAAFAEAIHQAVKRAGAPSEEKPLPGDIAMWERYFSGESDQEE